MSFEREEFIPIPSGYNLTSVMSDSHADNEDDEDGIGVLQGPADTETDDRDEEKNNVDNENDEENEITPPSSPRDFPVVVENEVVVAGVIAVTSISPNSGGLVIQSTSSRPSALAAGSFFRYCIGFLIFWLR